MEHGEAALKPVRVGESSRPTPAVLSSVTLTIQEYINNNAASFCFKFLRCYKVRRQATCLELQRPFAV